MSGPLHPTTVSLDAGDVVADVDPRLFGGLLEHMGRCVYEGVYEPTSAHADEHGCRTDVLDALRQLDMTAIRYPGGNFVSGYDWRDGIGPQAERPERPERAWRSIETNQFGTDEFLPLCERMGWTPMMAVNLGTGTAADAQSLVAYVNEPAGTAMGDWRSRNGRAEPYGVDLWCLGNEMDGPWQLGHTNASEYTRRAREAAAAMRDVTPDIEVVACGSSDPKLPSHPAWSITVLDEFGEGLEYLSLHRYARNFRRQSRGFLGFGRTVDDQIEETARLCDEARSRHGYEQPTRVSFDEWNVWYKTAHETLGRMLIPSRFGRRAPHVIEEVYNLEDALVAAGFLNSFLRHADVVRVANIAQLVNVIAPLLTKGDRLLVQSIFHTFRMFTTRRDGHALRVAPTGPTYETRRFGTVPEVDLSAVLGPDALHVFAVNRSLDAVAPLEVTVAGTTLAGVGDCEILTGPHPRARNTWDDPHVIEAAPFGGLSCTATSADLQLPPLSLAAATFPLAST